MSVELAAFDFIKPAGEGATATVWQARHRSTGRLVAIKILPPSGQRIQLKLRRFRAEVRAVAQLNHSGVVRLYDHGLVGEATSVEGLGAVSAGTAFIVMEWVDGGDLHRRGRLDWAQTRAALLAILEALAAAHARGTIHRDIKPRNILRSARGPLITDFGIAFMAGEVTAGDEERRVVGTPDFLAPEQARAKWRQYGPWTDLYSVGCLAHYLVCGDPPYRGADPRTIMRRHLEAPIPNLRPTFAVPKDLEKWVARLLQKSPRARFQFAADAARALLGLGEAVPVPRAPNPLLSSGEIQRPSGLGPLEANTLVAPPVFVSIDSDHWGASVEAPERGLIPITWRPPRPPLARARLAGLGLSVFAIANAPFCGREAERDLLWARLRHTAAHRALTVSVIRGNAGSGKTILATWIAGRAHELGVAHVLTMMHVQGRAEEDGLSAMLESYFGSHGLVDAALRACIRDRLGETAPAQLSAELTALMSPDLSHHSETGAVALFQPAERARTLLDFIEFLGRDRAVVIVIDDLQWGANAVMLLNSLLESERTLPVAVLATVREYAPSSIPRWTRRLEAIVQDPAVATFQIGPLESAACVELIRSRIALSDRLAAQLIARTEGNPLFSEELVRQWLIDGALVLGNDGYRLRPEWAELLPASLHDLWQRRLRGAMEGATDDDWLALELAALLGRRFAERMWLAATDVAGLEVSPELLDGLADQGLLLSDDELGWSFTHALLCESVQLRAQHRGDWPIMHSHCADAVAMQPDRDEAHLAHHLLLAERHSEAVKPLWTALDRRALYGEYRTAQEVGAVLTRVFRRLGLPRRDAAWNRLRVVWALLDRLQGRTAQGMRHARRALELAVAPDQSALRADAYRELASSTPDVDEKMRMLFAAVALLEDLPRSESHVRLYLQTGLSLAEVNRIQEALRFLLRADEVLDALAGDGFCHQRVARLRPQIGINLAHVYINTEMWPQAREHAERAFSLAQASGARFAMGYAAYLIGHASHGNGDLDRAVQHYLECEDLWTSIGSFIAPAAGVGRALVEADRGAGVAACRIAEASVEAFQASGNESRALEASLQSIYCYAHAQHWSGFDARFAIAYRPSGYGVITHDTLAVFRKVLPILTQQGQWGRAHELLDVYRRRAEDLGQADLVAWAESFVTKPD